jgi:hypothetical protein
MDATYKFLNCLNQALKKTRFVVKSFIKKEILLKELSKKYQKIEKHQKLEKFGNFKIGN